MLPCYFPKAYQWKQFQSFLDTPTSKPRKYTPESPIRRLNRMLCVLQTSWMHLAILARYSCSIARTSALYLLPPSDMIKNLVGFFLSKRKKTNSSPYICLVCSVYIVQKIGLNKRTYFCPKSFVYIITMDKTKPNHRTIFFLFASSSFAIVSVLRLWIMSAVSTFGNWWN